MRVFGVVKDGDGKVIVKPAVDIIIAAAEMLPVKLQRFKEHRDRHRHPHGVCHSHMRGAAGREIFRTLARDVGSHDMQVTESALAEISEGCHPIAITLLRDDALQPFVEILR